MTDRTRASATKHQKMVCIVHISTFPISFQHMGASENGVESTLLPFDIGNIMITIDKAWDVWLSNIFRQTPAAAPPGQGLSQPLLVGAQLARGCSLPSAGESNGELDWFSIFFSHEWIAILGCTRIWMLEKCHWVWSKKFNGVTVMDDVR